jgi:hypothetical protein
VTVGLGATVRRCDGATVRQCTIAPSHHRTVGAAWPLAACLLLSTIWIPALGRGFSSDDFSVVPTTWLQFVENPFNADLDGRPIDMLVFALVPKHAVAQHAVSFASYLGCIVLMWYVCRRLALDGWSTFLALSSFFHPAFLWSVTWISQRNTVLAILFLLGAIAATRTPARLALIALCSATKAPYIFQNVVFAFQFARRGQFAASAFSLLCLFVFGLAGYLTYYDRSVGAGTLASPEIPVVLSFPLRAAKLVEGMLYVFAPVPMFAISSWGPVFALIVYVGLWLIVAQSLRPFRPGVNGWIPAMALAMCVPFVFASEVRVVGEAAVLTFLAVASAARWRRPARMALVGILALNLTGIGLNYGAFRSDEYDIQAAPVSVDTSQPAYAYQAWRETVRQRVLATLGVNIPTRTFE